MRESTGKVLKLGRKLKMLFSCVGEYRMPSVLTSLFVALEVLFEVFIPLIMSQIVDVGMDKALTQFVFRISLGNISVPVFTLGNRTAFIITCGALMVVMAIVSLALGALSARFAAKASTGFAFNLRKKLFYKVENFSFANLDRFNTASLVTRLTTDVTNVQTSYMMTIRVLVRSPFMLILAICMSVSISPRLSIIFAAVVPTLMLGIVLVGSGAFGKFGKMLRKYDKMNESTQENLIGIRAVKAFVREDNEIKKFKKVSDDVRRLQLSAERIIVAIFPLMQILAYTCVVCILYFGGVEVVKTQNLGMSIGDLTAFLSYVMQILMSVMMVAMVFMTLVMSRASMDRIVEVFDEEIDIKDCENALDAFPTDGSIDFENVDFSYKKQGDVLNLERINLHVKSGETIGIIGGTGSAKTTLVQLIPRFYDVYGGSVKVGGVDVKDYKIENLRSAIGMVLQKNVLFSGTIKQNLLWGNEDATEEEILRATKAAQAHEFISSFPSGYETQLEQGGVNVSGGQKQRLCIARALLKRPKIMILDDSTSAVDTATDAAIRAGLKREFGDTTVIIIAQRIASVENADRIVVLCDGKIDAVGTHESLLESNEIYKDVYFSQQKGRADEEVTE